jgi:hypothetical protein
MSATLAGCLAASFASLCGMHGYAGAAPAEISTALTEAPRDPAEFIEHIKSIIAADRMLDMSFYSDQGLQRAFGGIIERRQFASPIHAMIRLNHMGTLFESSSKAWGNGIDVDFDLDSKYRNRIIKAHFLVGAINDSRLTISDVIRDFGTSYVSLPGAVGPDTPVQPAIISYKFMNGSVRNTLDFSLLGDGRVMTVSLVQEKAD